MSWRSNHCKALLEFAIIMSCISPLASVPGLPRYAIYCARLIVRGPSPAQLNARKRDPSQLNARNKSRITGKAWDRDYITCEVMIITIHIKLVPLNRERSKIMLHGEEEDIPIKCIHIITSNVNELEWEYRDGIKSKGDKIMTACTHSTVIEDARNSQPKRSNATSSILSQRHTAESRIDVYMKYTMFMLCGG